MRAEPDAAIWSQEKNKWVYPGLVGLSGLAEGTVLWKAGGYVVHWSRYIVTTIDFIG